MRGRGLPIMLMAKAGSEHPFDIYTLSGLHSTDWSKNAASSPSKA
jgi:hypothetical protein